MLTTAIVTMILCSNDEALISLFRGDVNIDIYKQMASLIRNKPAELISADERAVSSSFFVLNLSHLHVNRHVSILSLFFVPQQFKQVTLGEFCFFAITYLVL